MRAKKIHVFDSPEDIMKKAKHKKFTFAQFLDNGVWLIVLNGTVGRYDGDENDEV